MNVNPGLGTDFRSLADGTALRRFEDSSGVRGEKCGANPWADPWSAAGHRRGAGSSPAWGVNSFFAGLLSDHGNWQRRHLPVRPPQASAANSADSLASPPPRQGVRYGRSASRRLRSDSIVTEEIPEFIP